MRQKAGGLRLEISSRGFDAIKLSEGLGAIMLSEGLHRLAAR